jgi:hypothetical protein
MKNLQEDKISSTTIPQEGREEELEQESGGKND